jgi:hypothetical protein
VFWGGVLALCGYMCLARSANWGGVLFFSVELRAEQNGGFPPCHHRGCCSRSSTLLLLLVCGCSVVLPHRCMCVCGVCACVRVGGGRATSMPAFHDGAFSYNQQDRTRALRSSRALLAVGSPVSREHAFPINQNCEIGRVRGRSSEGQKEGRFASHALPHGRPSRRPPRRPHHSRSYILPIHPPDRSPSARWPQTLDSGDSDRPRVPPTPRGASTWL